jgi:hypothetical protein
VQRVWVVLALAGFLAAGCSSEDEAKSGVRAAAKPVCPRAWRPGWQRLADRVDAPVYCPTWMPNPLDGRIGGQWDNGVSVDSGDRSYLVSFLWHEARGGDVHVNFRGYPGQTAVPTCSTTESVSGKMRRGRIPCFSDASGTRRLGARTITVYRVNQDVDQWHILYAWRRDGTLYTASQHVAPPLTYRMVVRSLDRIVRGLAVVEPRA